MSAFSPDPEYLTKIAIGAARHVRRFGLEPKIAFCFAIAIRQPGRGFGQTGCGQPLALLDSEPRDFCYEGEMNVDRPRSIPELRERLLPDNRMEGSANVLIFSNADAWPRVYANILKMTRRRARGWADTSWAWATGRISSPPRLPREVC